MRTSAAVAAGALALALGVSADKNYLGFNSGTTTQSGAVKVTSDFVTEFTAAQNLIGAPGTFNSFRLYTNIQGDTTNDPVDAFEAAIETNTYLLLGVWASGTDTIDDELTAMKTAVDQYGTNFTDLVIGISIGSEDLYRDSVTGVENDAGVGAGPATIVGFINDFKTAFANTSLASIPVGHVDTWDAWTNSSNSAVIDAIDWLGVDEYPFYQTTDTNAIGDALSLFEAAYEATVGVAGDKEVWVTETGWPYSGPSWGEGVASLANAKTYWDDVGCGLLFNKVPTFWYTLEDANSASDELFAITEDLSTTPRFNLTCPANSTSIATSASVSASATATTGGSATVTGARAVASGTSTSTSGSSSASSTATTAPSSGAAPAQMFSAGLALAAAFLALL